MVDPDLQDTSATLVRDSPSDTRAWLKLALLAEGLRPTDAFLRWFGEHEQYVRRRNFYNTPGSAGHRYPQEIRLAGKPQVTVAVNDYGPSRWLLDNDEDYGPCVLDSRECFRYPVEMIEDLPAIKSDPEIAQVANLYGGSALSFFSPRTCYFFAQGTQCQFCSLQGTAAEHDEFSNRVHPEQVRRAVAAAAADTPELLTQVMIVGGNERNLDVGFTRQVDLVTAASEELDRAGLGDRVSVHLIAMPPRDLSLIDRLGESANVHAGFNLEIWGAQRFTEIAPGKHRDYGQPAILHALEYLRDVVGPYRAHSILIAGLEAPEDTLNGARWLADQGISPIINSYHSDQHSVLGLTIRPHYTTLAAVAQGLNAIHEDYPVLPYWKGCGRNALDYEAANGLFTGPAPEVYR